MRGLLFAIGLLGVAALIGWFEPVSASARPVTSEDVQLASEAISSQEPVQANYRNGMGNCQGGRRSCYCR